MAVFTRFTKVIETDGSSISVRTALGIINQALDEVLTEQESEFDADTRWALAWFEQHAHAEGPFGDAETLCKAKNVSLDGLRDAGIVWSKGGKVRLLSRGELDSDWDPTTDARLTVWEVSQQLIRRLDQAGESGAADLLRKLGGVGEVARDLAYRLYTTCERKKWAQEALAYNSLVVAWPEVSRLSRHAAPTQSQTELFG
jgi:putative DNA methylase